MKKNKKIPVKQIKRTSYLGVRGRRLKIQPERLDSLLQGEDLNFVKRGLVIGAGPYATAKVGDVVIFTALGMDKVEFGDEVFYYVLDTDQFVLEIL